MHIYFLSSNNGFGINLVSKNEATKYFHVGISDIIEEKETWNYDSNKIKNEDIEEALLIRGDSLIKTYNFLLKKLSDMLDTYFSPEFLIDEKNNPFGNDYEPVLLRNIYFQDKLFEVDAILDLGYDINFLYSFIIEPMKHEINNNGGLGVLYFKEKNDSRKSSL